MATRRITTKDGSWVQTDNSNVTDGDHSIDVKWKDWNGVTHRQHILKEDIVDDREFTGGGFVVIAAVIVLLLLASNC